MVQGLRMFSSLAVTNEVSKSFLGKVSRGTDTLTVDTALEYEQLKELLVTSMSLNSEAVFHVAKLASNRANALLSIEILIIEDLLHILERVNNNTEPVVDTKTISNANTILRSLESSQVSVAYSQGTERFDSLMASIADKYRTNVVGSGGTVFPEEEASELLVKNFTRLQSSHAALIESLGLLSRLLEDFQQLDAPSKVSKSVFAEVAKVLESVSAGMSSDPAHVNVAKSRPNLLSVLSAKSSVKALATFRPPTSPRVSTGGSSAEVTGQGTPAEVSSLPGPWSLPVDGTLSIQVNGGTAQEVDLSVSVGSSIVGSVDEEFIINDNKGRLHVIVDQAVFESTMIGDRVLGESEVQVSGNLGLTFRNLGSPVMFIGVDSNAYMLDELLSVATGTAISEVATNEWEISGWVGVVADDSYAGGYIVLGANRVEILEVLSADAISATFRVSNPYGVVPSGAVEVRADVAANSSFTVSPSLADPLETGYLYGTPVSIGPSIKTVEFPLEGYPGYKTISSIVSDIESGEGVSSDIKGLYPFVSVTSAPGDSTKLAITPRAYNNPYASVTSFTIQVNESVASPLEILKESAHAELGFLEGQKDKLAASVLTVADLAAYIENSVEGVTAVEDTLTFPEAEGQLYAGYSVLQGGFAGVAPNDILVVKTGSSVGEYTITSADETSVDIDGEFIGTELATYEVKRPHVRIALISGDPGTTLQVTSTPGVLGFPTELVSSGMRKISATGDSGEVVDFSEVQKGDYVTIRGKDRPCKVVAATSDYVEVDEDIPSTIGATGVVIESQALVLYRELSEGLTSILTSTNSLAAPVLENELKGIGVEISRIVFAGAGMSRRTSKLISILSELLSALTSEPPQSKEYSALIPEHDTNVSSILAGYSAAGDSALDSALDSLKDRSYDRAYDLLSSGRFVDFYSTDYETGSYAGLAMYNMRNVDNDLPEHPGGSLAVSESSEEDYTFTEETDNEFFGFEDGP